MLGGKNTVKLAVSQVSLHPVVSFLNIKALHYL